jgi:hypothetical protein
MLNARSGHASALLSGGKVIVTGGSFNGSMALVEIYDPQANAWTAAAGGIAVTRLSSSEVYGTALGDPCGALRQSRGNTAGLSAR